MLYQHQKAFFFKDFNDFIKKASLQSKEVETDDINEKLRSLKESDVKITFTDIYVDWRNYRKEFFYGRVRESFESIA